MSFLISLRNSVPSFLLLLGFGVKLITGYSVKTSPLTPAGPLPERVAARSGANTCGKHTAAAAGSTEPD